MSPLVNEVDPRLELNSDQLSLLKEFKQWVEEEAKFYGRTDEDFLILFLRSCDFDLELSRKTLKLYYQARIKYSLWWANRNLNEPLLQFLFQNRFAYALKDEVNSNSPAVMMVHLSRAGPNSAVVNPAGKYFTCGLDMVARRRNCQLNGGVLIFDCYHNYSWLMWKLLWPPFVRDMVNSFLLCVPIKINMVVLANAPAFTSTFINVVRYFLPEGLKNKVQSCRSLNDISQFVPLEVLPAEWGGGGGPAKEHEDDAINDILNMSGYFMDDNKYGFRSNNN